ncbi:LOW QUALITY PROTEIN: DNA-binding protein inhibitor ID-4-like [Urocitellus parryii]
MKAVSPVRPSGCGSGELALHYLAQHGHSLGGSAAATTVAAAHCKAAEAAADELSLCLQCDMNDYYSRLRRLVPTILPNKKVSKVEILQHVINYILALETHPALLRQPPPPVRSCPAVPPRTLLTAFNTGPVRGLVAAGDNATGDAGGWWQGGGKRAFPLFGVEAGGENDSPQLLLQAPGAACCQLA